MFRDSAGQKPGTPGKKPNATGRKRKRKKERKTKIYTHTNNTKEEKALLQHSRERHRRFHCSATRTNSLGDSDPFWALRAFCTLVDKRHFRTLVAASFALVIVHGTTDEWIHVGLCFREGFCCGLPHVLRDGGQFCLSVELSNPCKPGCIKYHPQVLVLYSLQL